MKKTLLAFILAACASSALAAPTAVLKVKGVLTNAACSLNSARAVSLTMAPFTPPSFPTPPLTS